MTAILIITAKNFIISLKTTLGIFPLWKWGIFSIMKNEIPMELFKVYLTQKIV